jgi:FkbM family methyltransferase
VKMSQRRLTRAALVRAGRVAAGAQRAPTRRTAGEWRGLVEEANAPTALQRTVTDDSAMERARTQWLYGDWDSLSAIDVAALSGHPDRAKLALLAAAGQLQAGELQAARALLRRAADWGCNKRLVSQVLVASVHNVLGRAASIAGREEKARVHFEQSIATVAPSTDTRLLGHARSVREMVRLGMLPEAAAYASDAATAARQPQLAATHARAHQKVVDLEVDWLRDRVVQLQKQIYGAGANEAPITLVKAPRDTPVPVPASPPAEPKKFHGLHGLDRKLEVYLGYDGGYFVELGANDGVDQSNTLYFERERGWRGVLIEPILHNFLKCQANRAQDNAFFCAACVSEDYEEPYVRLTYSNLMTTPHGVDSDIADPTAHAQSGAVYLKPGEQPVEVMAVARTLSSLLAEAGAPAEMDLLSLDVEGAELEVLKGLDHDRHRFRYMLVECRDAERLGRYLAEANYVLIDKISQHDYLFCARDRRGVRNI